MPILQPPSSLYLPPDLSDLGLSWRTDLVLYHGPRRRPVYPGRRVLVGTWPVPRPEDCPNTSDTGVWVADGRLLICPTCGLDQT